MKNTSIWNEYELPKYESLKNNNECDVLIIGGGLSGVSLLYHLKNSGLKVILVERNRLGRGVTCRTTGKLTYFLDNVLIKVKKRKGLLSAKELVKAYKEGVNISRKIISKEMIDCDLEKNTAYIMASKKSDRKYLKELKSIYNDKNVILKDKDTLVCKDSYVFNPIKYMDGLLHSLNDNETIYENTLVYDVKKKGSSYLAKTMGGDIKCKRVVFAGFYPYFLFPMVFPFNVDLEKSYVSATKVNNSELTNGIIYDKPTMSYRYYKDYLIRLGETHNLGLNFKPKEKFQNLGKANYVWSNTDIMTIDGIPYAGEIKKNMYILTGYNTWGMAGSSIASKIVSDEIQGKENIYSKLFDPKRSMGIYRVMEWGKNTFTNPVAYIGGMVCKSDKVRYKNGIAEVTLKDGSKYVVKRKCSHLGCDLVYNEVEKTWDCPCHASRFDIDGKVIVGPSRYDVSVKK